MFVPVMLSAALLTYRRGDGESEEDDGAAECPAPSFSRAGGAGVGVGLMTGFFGVGGGFLIVPALTLLLGAGDAPGYRDLTRDHHFDGTRCAYESPRPRALNPIGL